MHSQLELCEFSHEVMTIYIFQSWPRNFWNWPRDFLKCIELFNVVYTRCQYALFTIQFGASSDGIPAGMATEA